MHCDGRLCRQLAISFIEEQNFNNGIIKTRFDDSEVFRFVAAIELYIL